MPSRIPILVYHSVSERPAAWIAPYTVSPRLFAAHLDAFTAAGVGTMSVSELADAVKAGGGSLPERPLVLTFDDGFGDFGSVAHPLLAERELRATLYVVTAFAEAASGPAAEPMLSWAELAALAAAGVELGAHTHTHPQLDVLDRRAAGYEIERSRSLFAERLGIEARSFAYPHGYSSPSVRRIVRECGFSSACAVGNAFSHPRDDLYRLSRIMVRSHTSAADVAAWAAGTHAPLAPAHERISTRAWRIYRRAAVRAGLQSERRL